MEVRVGQGRGPTAQKGRLSSAPIPATLSLPGGGDQWAWGWATPDGKRGGLFQEFHFITPQDLNSPAARKVESWGTTDCVSRLITGCSSPCPSLHGVRWLAVRTLRRPQDECCQQAGRGRPGWVRGTQGRELPASVSGSAQSRFWDKTRFHWTPHGLLVGSLRGCFCTVI